MCPVVFIYQVYGLHCYHSNVCSPSKINWLCLCLNLLTGILSNALKKHDSLWPRVPQYFHWGCHVSISSRACTFFKPCHLNVYSSHIGPFFLLCFKEIAQGAIHNAQYLGHGIVPLSLHRVCPHL